MSVRTKKRSLFVVLAMLLVTLLASDVAFAQCAMCRTTLEQNAEMAIGFNHGILFLLGMPYLVFGSIALSWYLRRRKTEMAIERRQALGNPMSVPESGV